MASLLPKYMRQMVGVTPCRTQPATSLAHTPTTMRSHRERSYREQHHYLSGVINTRASKIRSIVVVAVLISLWTGIAGRGLQSDNRLMTNAGFSR